MVFGQCLYKDHEQRLALQGQQIRISQQRRHPDTRHRKRDQHRMLLQQRGKQNPPDAAAQMMRGVIARHVPKMLFFINGNYL